MTNMKSTKKALIASILSLCMCFSMLLGTTFAWFTDSVTSANNIITAGNLDVELYWTTTPEDDTSWVEVDGNTNVFKENTLWEPGHTEVVYLKVVNAGTLALKYQLGVNVASEVYSTNVNGDPLKLSDHIKYGIANYTAKYQDAANAIAAVDAGATALSTAWNSGTIALESGANKVVAMVVYMPETVGNEANYAKDAPQAQINLGINLFATQYNKEADSFGDDYDEDAWGEGFKVTTAGDLKAAIANGETNIVLENDIELTESLVIPAPAASTFAMRSTPNAVKIDLNGKTIIGAGLDKDGKKAHVIVNNGVLELKNGTVTSAGENGGSVIYNAEGATLTLENVTVTGAPQSGEGWPSYAINSYGEMTINGADITSTHGALALYGDTVINDANVTMNGFGGSSHVFYIGGEGTDVTVNGGTYTHKGNIDGSLAYIMTGTTMTVNGGTFSASNGGYGLATYTGSLIVNGGTFANAFLDWGGPISIAGGTFYQNPSKYVADECVVVTNADGTYTVLKGDVVAGDNAALNGAIADGERNIALGKGEFSMPTTNGDVIISGTLDTVITINKPTAYKVTLNGVTVVGSGNYTGIQHSDTVVYENCVVKGVQFLYANEVIFKNCTIDLTEKADYIWTYGAKNVTFDNCTFNTKGKAILIYSESADLVTNVTVKNCTFNATESALAGGNVAAAIEIDSSLSKNGHYTLTTENNTVDADFSGEWRIKKCSNNNTTVNGVLYNIANPDTIQAMINGANAGDEITLAPGNYKTTIVMKSNITLIGSEGAVVDCINLNGSSNVTLKGITFDAANAKMAYGGDGKERFFANIIGRDISNKSVAGARGIVIEECTFEGTFANGGMAICFSDQTKTQSGDITIKNCTFNTIGGYVDIYTYYAGYGDFIIEGNTFASENIDRPIYLGKYQSSTAVVVTGNKFETKANIDAAAYIQDHSNYGVSIDASNNTFAN